jgi:hypothetical protein
MPGNSASPPLAIVASHEPASTAPAPFVKLRFLVPAHVEEDDRAGKRHVPVERSEASGVKARQRSRDRDAV